MKNSVSGLRLSVSVATVIAISAIVFVLSLPKQNAQSKLILSATYERFATADDITRDIRSGSKEMARVDVANAVDRREAARYGRIVIDYGSFVVIVADRGSGLERSGLQSQSIETSITLPGTTFDPVSDPPPGTVRPGSPETASGKGYYIVQFGGIVNDEWLDSLRDAGVEILQYVPHNAFFVYADGAAISKAAAHSRVRWVGAYLPDQKISPILGDQVAAAKSKSSPPNGISPLEMTGADTSIFDVAVWKRADLQAAADVIASSFGGRTVSLIDLPNNYFNVVRVELPIDKVLSVSTIPDVITIDFYSKPTIEDEGQAAHIVAGNYTGATTISGPGYNPLTQFGVNGANVTISMVDDGVSIPGAGGFYVTSTNTNDGPLRGSTSGASGGHGHLNASIISGAAPFGNLDATGHNYGLGVAPNSNIINIPFLKAGYSGTESNTYDDTVSTNGVNGVKGSISNNSWGNGTNSNVYDAYTAGFDGFVRDASAAAAIDPILLVFSAGNSGPGALTLTRPKTAKNIIATGNSENLRPELSASANNMEDLASSSSRGPAADGRVKPDITAPGTVITGSRAGDCSSVSSCFETNHAWSTGTSHAAPQVAGAAALFTQFWKSGNGGVNPSPALVKAAIINTAQEMTGTNVTAAIPNGAEGWGRINMKLMLNTGVAMKRVNQTTEFGAPGNAVTYTGTVADATKPIRITLVWTDPPGAASANPALVNNLDLTATIGANTYRGNVFTSGVSTTGGSADTINNVENVFLPSGVAAGTAFSITISATALNGDGILGNADATDQHFGLVAYNFAEQVIKSRADFDGDGKTDRSVYRPSDGNWYLNRSTAGLAIINWGLATDTIVPGDYDEDGKADTAIFRPAAPLATPDYFVLNSNGFTVTAQSWGLPGDIPLSGDYDGDGRTDFAVFRPSENAWYIRNSGGGETVVAFGLATDIPVAIDNDGDGKTNLAVFRPSNNTWYIAKPTGVPSVNFDAIPFGFNTDLLAPADYDGDNKDDIAVFRPSTGTWYVLRSSNGALAITPFGLNGDVPVPGDYDGDGSDDLAVYRAGTWHVLQSTSGYSVTPFGIGSDKPVPKGYIP